MNYGKITEETLVIFQKIVSKENVSVDQESLEKYSYDETPHGLRHCPDVVIKPENTRQVSDILKLVNKHRIPVTFRGQGTGLANGAVPLYGGVVMSFEKMNKIAVDEDNLMAEVEAGTVLFDLRQEVEKRGLFYPADPGEKTSTMGGNVATNAGGMNCVKYGKVRDYVLGLEIVLSSGKILMLGGKTVKRSSGYELMHLIIGSEGTLAAVTKVIIKLIKLPKRFITLYIPFDEANNAVKSVSKILKKRITPTAMEFVEREVILETEKQTGKKMPHNESEAYLIIRIDGDDDTILFEEGEKIANICLENGALDVFFADSKERQHRIWDVRSLFYDGVVKNKKNIEIIDTVIPPSKIADYMRTAKKIADAHGIKIIGFGHAGDGNIHLHPIGDGLSQKEWYRKHKMVMKELYESSVALGGTISGEHGIGVSKKEYLQIGLDENQISLMREIKKIFDPNIILNPGKIFDME
ncbi:MAG: FAD-binding oxidoreductase [Candidatus Bathyarchaeota archaeon]|nr:MAG: FAD-binding oxidoreductase [Candidatus Bathyarchaeota archaeon]